MMLPALLTLTLGAWPAFVPAPPGVSLVTETMVEATFDEAKFLEGGATKALRGPTWTSYFSFDDGQSHPASQTWAQWRPLLVAKGWAVTGEDGNTHALVRRAGKEEWRASVTLADFDQPKVVVVKVGGAPMKLTAAAPTTVAGVSDDADWPFAPKLPGATLSGTGLRDLPLVAISGNERVFIADGYRIKEYAAIRSLSRLEFVLAVGEAFKKAGWVVIGADPETGALWAHYAKAGHDVWVAASNVADGTSQAISFAVANLGGALSKALDSPDCRVALRGVTFDFDRATLRPESEVVLREVAQALVARAQLKVEVAGHTDDVGDPAYNEQLSGRRAATVQTWLVAHGVPAARLSAHGYGKSHPIAPNDTEEGRAKNRRVELQCGQ